MTTAREVMERLQSERYGAEERFVQAAGRDALPGIFQACGFSVGVEVGVHAGEFSEQLCRGMPGLHLYCVDPWTPYRAIKREEDHRTARATALRRLAPYHVTILPMSSAAAAAMFKRPLFDFVYLDGNHRFTHVAHDLVAWSDLVKPGGIVAGHDYETDSTVGLVVNAYRAAFQVGPMWVLGQTRPWSFVWVKP